MKKENENPLKVIQETDPPAATSQSETKEEPPKEKKEEKSSFELPDSYLLAKEMNEIFGEDMVTHVQGPSEPEAD
jgi:hypothetical protein